MITGCVAGDFRLAFEGIERVVELALVKLTGLIGRTYPDLVWENVSSIVELSD